MNKGIRGSLFYCAVTLALAVGPAARLPAQAFTSPAVDADEKAMAAEKRPDFSSPAVVDRGLVVPGLAEKLVWYTSRPGVFGSARARPGGTYHGYMSEYPETFRTVGPNANDAYRPYFLTSQNTVDINAETKQWMPALATDWAFGADGRSVYFKLNEKARWTDGPPVTSADYTFMYDMMRSPNIQDPWSNDYFTSQITDLKAFGDWVIKVTWQVPASHDDLLYNLAVQPRPRHFYAGGIPKDYVDRYNWVFEPTAGPYALDSFRKGESLTFRKVKDWWGYVYDYNRYRFNADTLQYTVITGGNDIVRNYFYNGQIDSYGLLIPQEWADAANRDPVKKGYIDRQIMSYVPLTGVSGIILNTKDPLFANVDVRRGLYYAIAMQKMIDTALRGEYARYHTIGLGHLFGGQAFDDASIRKPDFDPVKAGALFDKAGYSKFGPDGIRMNAQGDRLAFELLYQSTNHTERLSVLKEEAQKAGVDIELKLMQQGGFTAVLEKKFQAWWGAMSTGLYDDYWQYFDSANANKPQTNNFWGYSSKDMDRLVEAFRAESDLVKKAALSREIQRKVDQEALVIPNYYVPYWRGAAWKWIRFPAWLSQKYHDDFYDPLSSTTGYVGYFWIDPDIQKEVTAARRGGKAYPPRIWRDETYKMPGR